MKLTIARKLWTETEINVIIKQVKLYPDNKSYAFSETAKILKDRNISTITAYYYSKMLNGKTISTTGSSTGFTSNRKNTKVNTSGELVRKEPLKPIVVIMRQLLDLPQEDLLKISRLLKEICN